VFLTISAFLAIAASLMNFHLLQCILIGFNKKSL
jgi:hypothetical protein